ncbi:MAG: hypothetical protein ACRER2_16275 [Methylococcales bacterium]
MSTKNPNDCANPSNIEEGLSDEQRVALEGRRRFVRNALMAGGLLATSGVLTVTAVRPAFAQAVPTGGPGSPVPALGVAGLAALGALLGGGALLAKKKLEEEPLQATDNSGGTDDPA